MQNSPVQPVENGSPYAATQKDLKKTAADRGKQPGARTLGSRDAGSLVASSVLGGCYEEEQIL